VGQTFKRPGRAGTQLMTIAKATIHHLLTGIPGLDEVLGGGLPEFSFNVIAGSPGCGKTTLAHQLMFALATPERPALYFTVLGEAPLKMLRYQQQFEFFDSDKVNHSIHFINLADDAVSGDLSRVLARIVAEVETHAPSLVFVDSFRSVILAGERDGDGNDFMTLQHFVQQLGMLMTSWQATTFLIGEYFDENEPSPVFTVADGLIRLQQSVQRNSMVRKLEITAYLPHRQFRHSRVCATAGNSDHWPGFRFANHYPDRDGRART
jgi:circadian clock protein KaiC